MERSILSINKPHVNSEVFEDEVVVVNLLNGFYYSINKTGIDIWILIEKKLTKDQILKTFLEKYPDNRIQEEVSEFVDELINESLVTEIKADEDNPVDILNILKSEYHKPGFEKYTDMQDILLLDPIHDIDETGWPKKPADVNKTEYRQD
jgi:hypothetical protein